MVASDTIRSPIPRGKARERAEPISAPPGTDISKEPPGLRFAPTSVFLMQRGVDAIANVVRPTLGPMTRHVAVAPLLGTSSKPPELLDDGATIARRIVEIPDPYVNMGAMLARHVLWNVYEQVGDGSATAAVIMQALLQEGVHLATAGWNVMAMQRGIQRGLDVVTAALRTLARPIETEDDVVGLALAASGDPDLAKRLGEIFDTVGADGHVEVQEAYARGFSHEYIEGAYWKSGWISPAMSTNDIQTEARLQNPYILVARGRIESWEEIAPILGAVANQSDTSLFIIALDVSGTALNLLLSNRDKVISAAAKAPAVGEFMESQLEDIAVLTGTRVILNNMGESVAKLALEDLGRARSVTVNRDYFGIVGGQGDPKLLRERIALLRNQLKSTDVRESEKIGQLRERLGKLVGGVAVLYISEPTEAETKARVAIVERTINTVKQAQLGGIVPGGGMAYIHCIPALRELKLPEEQAIGVQALARALEEPLRTIARNSGYDEGPIAALALAQPQGWGFNAMSGAFEDLWAAKIVDPLPIVMTALDTAVSGALMTLTSSVTVHRRKPPTSTEP